MKNEKENKVTVSETRSQYYGRTGVIESVLPNDEFVMVKIEGERQPVIMSAIFLTEGEVEMPALAPVRRSRLVPRRWHRN